MTIKIMSGEDLNKAIMAVNKASHKIAADIQMILVTVTYYALKEGSVSELNALWLGLGKGALRRQAIQDWATTFGPFLPNDNKKTMADKPFVFDRQRADVLLQEDSKKATAEAVMAYCETASKTMWTEYKEPPMVPTDWSLSEAICALYKKAESYAAKGVKIGGADLMIGLKPLAHKALPLTEPLEGV